MTTKLTLTVEKEIIEKSKSFAKKTGTSLSNIVENYLASIVEEKQNAQVSEKLSKIEVFPSAASIAISDFKSVLL